METNRIIEFINSDVIKSDPVLKGLLLKWDSYTNRVLVISNYAEQSIFYISAPFADWSGYPQEFFMDGIHKIVSVTDAAELPRLSLQQSAYVQQTKSKGFEPGNINLHEYTWTIIHQNKYRVPLLSFGVVLTYSSKNDFEWSVGFHLLQTHVTDNMLKECKSDLLTIKYRHNEIYRHRDVAADAGPYPLHYVSKLVLHITDREKEVLGMLAKGKSSHEIAAGLLITENTVESHRKNLLQKFEAKNSAELIKKASKVFWLE